MDITELKEALRVAINADANVSGLMHANNDSILEADPAGALSAPFVTWSWSRVTPDTMPPGRDDWSLSMLIYAASMAACHGIGSALQDRWTIPHEKNAGVASTNYRLTRLFLTSENEAPGIIKGIPGLADVRLLVQTWHATTRSLTDTD